MKSGDMRLTLALLRGLPRLLFAVGVQAFGLILLGFLAAVLLPEQKWLPTFLAIPYLCWSTWRLQKSIARWSKAY